MSEDTVPAQKFRRVKFLRKQPKERRKRFYELLVEKSGPEDVAPFWITRCIVVGVCTVVLALATSIPAYYMVKAFTVSQTVKACVTSGKTWKLASNTKQYECR